MSIETVLDETITITIERHVRVRTRPQKLALVACIGLEEREDLPTMQTLTVPMTDRQRIRISFAKAQDADGNEFDVVGPVVPTAQDPTAVLVVPNTDPSVVNGFFVYANRVPGKLGLQKVVFLAENAGLELDAIVGGSAPTNLVPIDGVAEDFPDEEFPTPTPPVQADPTGGDGTSGGTEGSDTGSGSPVSGE